MGENKKTNRIIGMQTTVRGKREQGTNKEIRDK